MAEPSPRSGAGRAPEIVFGVVLATLIVAATLLMFSTFMTYDDEGYVLLSLKNFAEKGGLYRELYSQYGPFPFVAHQLLHSLGLPFTHLAGRLLTVAMWAGAAVACATLVHVGTRHLWLRLWVLTSAFCLLWVMANEPTHPGGWIVLLTTVLAAAGYRWLQREQIRPWSILAGALTGVLLLTKINIGFFAVFAIGGWWLLHHEKGPVRRWAPAIVATAGVVLPFALMRPLLDTPWVLTFAWLFAMGAITVVTGVALAADARTNGRTLGTGALAMFATMAVIAGATWLRGSTARDLVDGVLLGPLRHPTSFTLRYDWPAGIRGVAVVSLLVCATCVLLRRRGSTVADHLVAFLRLAATLALAFNLGRYPAINPAYLVLGWTLPTLWFFAWPLVTESRTTVAARAFVILLLLGQILHAYPVPGSQMAWGTVLALPLAACGAWEALMFLRQRVSARSDRALRFAGAGVAIFAAALNGWHLADTSTRYRDGENLGLPGAEPIRLPTASAARLRALTINATAHADVLFGLPGVFSFNLWTDLPTPTRANVTHWFSLLDENRQQEIIRALASQPRACVIVDRPHLKYLADRALAPKGPLYDYVTKNFEPAFSIDGVEFHVHRGRTIEPFLVGELFALSDRPETPRTAESALLQLSLLTPPTRPVTSVALDTRNGPVLLDADNTRIEIMPLNSFGEPLGLPQPAAWPLTTTAPARVFFYFDGKRQPPIDVSATIILRDAAGHEVGLARMKP